MRTGVEKAGSPDRSLDEQMAAAQRRIEACEAALEESEARFRHIIERNADAIIVIGDDGLVQYANAMAGRLFGVETHELHGTPFGFPVASGETTDIDVVAGGVARVAQMRVVESTWNGGPVLLATLRDVTDLELARRERTNQLAAAIASARLQDVFSQAPVAIAVLRGRDLRYEISNSRYAELVGNREVMGQPIREALPELAGQGIYELLDQVYSTGVPYIGTDLPLIMTQASGELEERFFNFVYHPLREAEGHVSGIAIVATEVTAQVRDRHALEASNHKLEAAFESEQLARAEAETANKAKADFLATMSHELRTPLNAIGGYADLLLGEIRGPITDAQRADLDRINHNQRHLLSVINDILNFAKVEAGRLQLAMRDISMNEILGELESLVAPLLLQKQLRYDYRCCDASYQAHTDPERLQQILLNLLSNAAKFTPSGGQISVECGATRSSMRVRVRDTGIGIPADKLQQVFEPFVQLENARTTTTGGTGLGLAISRDLARAMGGDLIAESIPNEGSTFTLTLPRAARTAPHTAN